jgi:hypothetical protein
MLGVFYAICQIQALYADYCGAFRRDDCRQNDMLPKSCNKMYNLFRNIFVSGFIEKF